MVPHLIKHERIETTVAKAKEVRRMADRMVQLRKEGTELDKKRVGSFVRGDDIVYKKIIEFAYRYKGRVGGYTRLLKTCIRQGDVAEMDYIEFIDCDNELR